MKKIAIILLLTLFLAGHLPLGFFVTSIHINGSQESISSPSVQRHVTMVHKANAMWIEPPMVELNPNEIPVGYRFNITFWANASLETKGWQFWMIYPNIYINATKAGYTAGATSEFFQNITTLPIDPQFMVNWNETHNRLIYGEAWLSGPHRSPGWGSLCWVEFEVVTFYPGSEPLQISLDIKWAYDLYDPPRTYLYYSDGTYRPLTIYNGLVELVPTSPAPPIISILSPTNTTYHTSSIPLSFSIDEPTSWIGYSLNDEANVTITGNTILTGLAAKSHSVVIYANDTFGNMGSSAKVYFTIQFNHDIALTHIALSKTIVSEGCTMEINTTAQNQGDIPETFNLTLYANTTIISNRQHITLSNGTSVKITLTWNTTGFARGDYTISAYASPIPGETDLADNLYVDGVVTVGWLYDVTGDGYCGIDDIVAVAEHFGINPNDPNWNHIYDVTGDDYIGIDDIVLFAEHFGQTA